MILLDCPYCGKRNSDEFRYVGEIHARPAARTNKTEWRDYLYMKDNPAGQTNERWFHVAGCGKFLLAERHTVTNEVLRARPEGAVGRGPGASSDSGPTPGSGSGR
ncbi:MAG: sarcosine oxidase subunit delta [Acidimicrobiales bacterium]